MSSHHFVKEGQEPALFIFDAVSFDIVGPLLEWAPLVLVSEDALECARQWGTSSSGDRSKASDSGPMGTGGELIRKTG